MNRREFIASVGAFTTVGTQDCLGDSRRVVAAGNKSNPLPWRKGVLQVHFLYAGSGESIFFIFPDGTTMLVDCGDWDCSGAWKWRNPVAPLKGLGPGEFVARYIRTVNPFDRDVDYWMLTHWHADHGGSEVSYSWREERDGEVWLSSGLAELIDTIRFKKGFDRCWPNLDNPFRIPDTDVRQVSQIARTYRWMERHQGVTFEKFRTGDVDQVKMVKDPSAFPGFHVTNVCGNGLVRLRTGGTRYLYEGFVPATDADSWRRENGLSLGFVMQYGAFSLFTAGDFQDKFEKPDGTRFLTEDVLASELGHVEVAKTNHHACNSMPSSLVKALSAKVWVTASTSFFGNAATTMQRLSDRSLYPGERIICPTHYDPARNAGAMGVALARRDVAPESFSGCHVVVSVPPGGATYDVSFLSPDCDAPRLLRTVSLSSSSKA